MNNKLLRKKRTVVAIIAIILLTLSCQAVSNLVATPTPYPTNTPRPTPTSTPISLSQLDLIWVTIHLDELPPDLGLKPSENISGAVDMEEIFPDYEQVHIDVVNAQYTSFATEDFHRFYGNGIFVYANEAQTIRAYEQIVSGWSSEPQTIPDLGDYAVVRSSESETLSNQMILWRYREALAYLTISTIGEPLPPFTDAIQLAQSVQSRMEMGNP